MARSQTKDSTLEAYCPHCFLLIESDVAENWPPEPIRCPHCRLLVGEGRSKATPDASPGARGTAAGVFAHRAKRDDKDPVPPEAVCEAIRAVARELGSRPERLLMVDYQQHASSDPALPELSDVFAAFGSWKRARREAAASG